MASPFGRQEMAFRPEDSDRSRALTRGSPFDYTCAGQGLSAPSTSRDRSRALRAFSLIGKAARASSVLWLGKEDGLVIRELMQPWVLRRAA